MFALAAALAAFALLSGCARNPTPGVAEPTVPEPTTLAPTNTPASAYTIPAPKEEGLASAGGTLYTIYGNAPIPGTAFYLTPAVGEEQDRPPSMLTGSHTEAGDIRGVSGPNGEIALDAIPPGRYFLVVWAPYNWIVAVESETEDDPRLLEFTAGEEVDLDRVHVPWP